MLLRFTVCFKFLSTLTLVRNSLEVLQSTNLTILQVFLSLYIKLNVIFHVKRILNFIAIFRFFFIIIFPHWISMCVNYTGICAIRRSAPSYSPRLQFKSADQVKRFKGASWLMVLFIKWIFFLNCHQYTNASWPSISVEKKTFRRRKPFTTWK